MNFKLIILPMLVILNLKSVICAPGDVSFIVSSTEKAEEGGNKENHNDVDNNKFPVIYEMDIKSNVSNRFAKTLITNKVKNAAETSREATFSVVLPEKAFISEFVMEIGGKSYKAHVKEKEEAKNIYDKAVSSGQSAAHVAVSARDSNRFTVSVNVEAAAKATFLLTYEELLERKNDKYELVINIHPGQVVKDLNVQVYINETRPLVFVKTPSLRSGNEVSKNEGKLDPSSSIEIINSTSAIVKFQPDTIAQKEFAKELGGKESQGLAGQFVVEYEVERDPHGGEVLLQDGYFVHFFAPKEVEILPKNVYFILDTSSSMYGSKIKQLKDAMTSILDEIKPEDTLSIVEFNSETFVWNIQAESSVIIKFNNYTEPFEQLSKHDMPGPIPATKENIEKTKTLVSNMKAVGGTYMIGGLEAGLYLVKSEIERAKDTENKRQPIIIFLTDGQPNIGLYSTSEITNVVTRLNKDDINVPMFSLSFGDGADKAFLRKLSLKNMGFSRHIYDAADASLQLQEFYKQISSPLLSNINFKYDSEAKELTKTVYPILFRGGEFVISGYFGGNQINPKVTAIGRRGPIMWQPKIEAPVTSLERLWAYLTVRETLEKRDAADNKTELTKKALDLALKYSFVTDVTSLVVVKPNATDALNTEDASKPKPTPTYYPMAPRTGFAPYMASLGGPSYSSAQNHRRYFASPVRHGFGYGGYQVSNTNGGYQVSNIFVGTTIKTPTTAQSLTTVDTRTNPSLENSLKWLAAALNANGTLTLPAGIFKLGDGSLTITPKDICAKTPKGEEGVCSLIKDCPEVFPLLADFEVYKNFSCAMQNEYAGVCCPKRTVPQYP